MCVGKDVCVGMMCVLDRMCVCWNECVIQLKIKIEESEKMLYMRQFKETYIKYSMYSHRIRDYINASENLLYIM